MKETDIKSSIARYKQQIHNRIIHDAFKWSMIVFIPAVILQFFRIIDTGFQPIMLLLFANTIVVIICVIFRNKLSYLFRTATYIAILFVMGIGAVFNYGLIGGGAWWLILSTTLSTLLFHKKVYNPLIFSAALVMLLGAIIYSNRVLTFQFDILVYAYSPFSWYASVIGITFVLLLISKSIERVKSYLVQNQTELLERNQTLLELTTKLEEEIENRKQIEEKLRNEKEFTNTALNVLSDIFVVFDPITGKAIKWNKAQENVTGYSNKEVASMKMPDSYFSKADLHIATAALERIYQGHRASVELNLICNNGDTIPYEYTGSVIADDFGKPKYLIAIGRDISERKEYEIKLKKSEILFNSFMNNIPANIYIKNSELQHIYVNQFTLNLLNMKYDDFIGTKSSDLFPLEIASDMDESDRKVLIEKDIVINEMEVTDAKGKKHWERDIKFPIEINSDELLIGGASFDITDQISNKKALYESREYYKTLFDLAGDAVFILKKDKIIDCNEQAIKLIGTNKEKIIGQSPYYFAPQKQPDGISSKERALKKIKSVLKGEPQQFEFLHQNSYGQPIFTEIITSVVDAENEISIGIWRDISQRKKYEKEIIQSEKKYRLIIENAPIVMWITTPDGITKYISPNVSKVYGYTDKEILSRGEELWLSRIHEDDVEKVKKSFSALFENNEPFDVQYRIKTRDKRWIWLSDKGEIGVSETGQELAYGIFMDITEQKNAELALKKSEKKYKALFTLAGDSVFLMQGSNIIDCNKKTEELFAGSMNQIVGLTPWDLSPLLQPDGKSSREQIEKILKSVLKGNSMSFEWQHKKFNGELFNTEISVNIIDINEGVFVVILRDITKQKQLQRRIYNVRVEAEEKERERFARELHDGLGPMLSAIKFNFEWLSETTDTEKRDLIIEMGNKNIEEAFVSLKEISNNLNPHILNNFGLFEAVNSFIEKISQKSDVKFAYTTNCDRRFKSELEIAFYRILQELVNNTLKYAKAKKVSINFIEDEDFNLLTLKYADDGIGFDLQETLNSKKGFGLFNIQNRITLLGGTVKINSTKGQGMKLRIDFNLSK